MTTATVTSKGQITIPKHIRDDLHLEPGSKVLFVKINDHDYRMIARTGKIQDLAGILHRPGQPTVSIEQMDEDIADAVSEEYLRGLRDEA